MPSNRQKQKSNKQVMYLYEQGQNLLFLSYESSHPKRIDIEEFHIGKFRLFRQDKVYSCELRSRPCLNPCLNWNSQTFELMLIKLEQFIVEEQNIDFDQSLFLSVKVKIKGRPIDLLRLRLVQQFGINPQHQIWSQFQTYSTFKQRHFTETYQKASFLAQRIQVSLDHLQQLQAEQSLKIEKFKGKLSVLLNQKQSKLLELSKNKNKFVYRLGTQQKLGDKNIQYEVVNWISSQDDHMLVGSLFDPSQQYLI